MNKKGLWYFAHPYTSRDSDNNLVPEAEDANFQLSNIRSAELIKRGYNIYSPISHTHPIHRACPEFLKNHEHRMWYNLDNDIIERTKWTGIIMAPNWEKSQGCTDERNMFVSRKLKIKLYENILKEKISYK